MNNAPKERPLTALAVFLGLSLACSLLGSWAELSPSGTETAMFAGFTGGLIGSAVGLLVATFIVCGLQLMRPLGTMVMLALSAAPQLAFASTGAYVFV